MTQKNDSRPENRLGDNPSLLRCLLEDFSSNLANGLGDALSYVADVAETWDKVKSHLTWKEKRRHK